MIRKGEEDMNPPWLNYTIHGYIMFLPGIEFFFLPRPQFSIKRATIIMSIFGMLYLAFLEYKLNVHDEVAYPFYKLLSAQTRVLVNLFFLTVVSPLCCLLSYNFRRTVHVLKEDGKEKFL